MTRALITGGSGGIGLAIANKLVANGTQVTLVARSEDKLQNAVQSLAGQGHDYVRADLSDSADLVTLAQHVRDNHYDILINNAGIGIYGRFTDIDLARQQTMLALNINALVALSHAYLENARSGDTLVNIASTLGISSFPGASAYAATKAFVVNFSQGLWWEYKDRGIFVTALCPGATKTDFHKAGGGDYANFPEMILQTPEQVADETINAINKRKAPVVISGRVNRLLIFSQRLLTRKQATNVMGRFSPLSQ